MKPTNRMIAANPGARLDEPSLAPATLRKIMGRFATGVTVVTTCTPDGVRHGVTANSFSTVSLDPPLVLWSLARMSRSHAAYAAARHFAVNVLSANQARLSGHFATPQADKFAGIEHRLGIGDCPLLTGAIAIFECEVTSVADGGDHSIFIGRVLAASRVDGAPLVYHDGAYHRTVGQTIAER